MMVEVTFYDQTLQLLLDKDINDVSRERNISLHSMKIQLVELLSLSVDQICIEHNGERLSDDSVFSAETIPVHLNVLLTDQMIGGKGGNFSYWHLTDVIH